MITVAINQTNPEPHIIKHSGEVLELDGVII